MSDLQTIARQLAIALSIVLPEDEAPETFAGLKFSMFKTKKDLRKMRVTLLQGKTGNTVWVKAKRAVVMNQEGEVTRYLGVAIPLSDGRFATYK